MNPEVTLEWIDEARLVLIHLGCPPELWMRVATGVAQSMDRLWHDSAQTAFLKGKTLEQITQDEFQEVFYSQYFFTIVRVKTKMKLLSLRQ